MTQEEDYLTLPQRIANIFNTCSEEEQQYLIQILEELGDTGTSPTYDNLFLQDYIEIPVDVDTFLSDNRYLGIANDGGKSVYPYWRDAMHTIYDDPLKYDEIVFTGATRIGKSSTGVAAAAYCLYRMMCLRNPQRFFKKKDISVFTMLFFNITLDLAKGVGFKEFNDLLKSSPWFQDHGTFSNSKIPVYQPYGDKIVIEAGSEYNHALGQQVFCAFIDEINFAKSGVKDISKAKARIKELYDVVVARIEGTFRLDGIVWGKLFAISSKKSDQDFLEDRIHNQLAAGNQHLVVFDAPQWEILPEGTFSAERFWLAVGDKHHKGFVVDNDSDEALQELKDQGYKLLQVPVDMKTNFLSDYDVALRDLAGISVPGQLSFITQEMLDRCIGTRKNPFLNDIITIGTKDSYSLEEFFHLEYIPEYIKHADWFIHLDLSLNDDKTGIGASCITGRKEILGEDQKSVSLPFFSQIFSVSLKAPTGDKIPYAKIVNFICWLRKQHINIELITRDQYQSEYLAQLLEAQDFKVDKISLDRTPDGYICLRSVLMEERVDMLHSNELETELILLQRDAFSGRVDHPLGGCFTEDTMIALVDGRNLSIHDLLIEQAYKTNWVYTVNLDTNCIEPKPIQNVFQSKLVTELLEVELDNGEVVTCTPEHRFMIRSGEYVEAQHLKIGQPLMPLYTKVSDEGLEGYRMFYDPFKQCWHYEHRMFCQCEQLLQGYVIHHRNFNKLDNCPTNLEQMSKSKHTTLHNNLTKDYRKVSKGVAAYHRNAKGSEKYKHRNEIIRQKTIEYLKSINNYKDLEGQQAQKIKDLENFYNIVWDDLSLSDKNKYSNMYARHLDPSIGSRISSTLSKRHAEGLFENAHKAISGRIWYTNGHDNIYIKSDEEPPAGYYRGRTIDSSSVEKAKNTVQNWSEEKKEAIRQRQSKSSSNRIWITDGITNKFYPKDQPIPDGFKRGRSDWIHGKEYKNHKVVAIRHIHKPCKVYDLTIQDNPNFALASGVFVHNSKDASDCFAGSIWMASKYSPGIPLNRTNAAKAALSANAVKPGKDVFTARMYGNIIRRR